MRIQPKYIGITALVILSIAAVVQLQRPEGPKTPELPEPSLQTLAAKHNIKLGNFAMPKLYNEKPYYDILTSQFDLALVDNQPNWHFTDVDLRPAPDKFNFSRVDQVVNFAQENHMEIEMHHYIWGEEKWLPDWLKNGNYTKPQLMDLMHNHIATMGNRYKGKVSHWSVVNEAFTRGQHMYGLRDWWGDHTGNDQSYIDQAFIWARQADPNSKLLLNDFQNEAKNDVSDAMYDYIKDAKARGVPIDGIGMQMHIDGTHPPTKDEVVANMWRFGQLGVKVYVTELDVNMNDVKADPKARDEIQSGIYYEMMRACIESKVCVSFSALGITDKETWYNYMPGTTNASPLMFDREYKPKPAFYSFRDALQQD
jgi:endo-1,4-beta-xylanase